MTICARLARLMGGRLWVESEPGQGSCFHFAVMLPRAHLQSHEPVASAAPEALRGVKALIVDDNLSNRRILIGMLNLWGMRSAAVEDGPGAIRALIKAVSYTHLDVYKRQRSVSACTRERAGTAAASSRWMQSSRGLSVRANCSA